MDAAKEGTGGVMVGAGDVCALMVFRYEWLQGIQDMVCTHDNPSGQITNSALKLAGLLICWLVMEEVAPSLYHKHVGLYYDNSAAVAWVDRMAT